MQFAIWRQISDKVPIMVNGTTPELPMSEGDVIPAMGF
jgi:hypothetical protein